MSDNISISDADSTVDNIEISMSDNAGDDTTETIILSDGSSIDSEKMSLVDTDYTSITDRLSTLETNVNNIVQDKTYTHVQATPSDTWVITHNLNKYPSVSLKRNTLEKPFFQAEIEYNNLNQLTVYMNGAESGWAYLN